MPQQQPLLPTYRNFANLSGGINVSQPEDEIGDTQSPDMSNLVYVNGVLQVDTGFTPYGQIVAGTPLQIIQFQLTIGTLITCLITSSGFYTWNSGTSNWVLVQNVILSTTTKVGYSSTCWTSDFSSAFGPIEEYPAVFSLNNTTGIVVGDLAVITLTSGLFYTSTVTAISGTVVTFQDSLLPGQIIASGATVTFSLPFHGGAFPISWTVDPTVNVLIWTNGVDPVQSYNSSGVLAPLAGLSSIASTARCVVRYYGFTLAIGTIEGGTEYPYRVRRSSNVSSTDWTSYAITGYDDLIDTADAILGVTIVGTYLIIARENSIMSASYWGTTDAIFFYQYMLAGTGVLGGNGVVKTRDIDYILSESGIFNYTGGYVLGSVGENVFNYFLGPQGNLNSNETSHIFGIYVPQVDEVWFFYPSTGSTYCDTILRYSQKFKSWFPINLPIEIAGAGFAYQTNAITWLESAGKSWIADTLSWNSRAAAGNFPILLLASALDRQVYSYDFSSTTWNGGEIPWYFVSKDFSILDEKLLFDGIVGYGKGNGVLCELSTDSGQTWITIGTFNFGTQNYTKQRLDYQITGDFFRFRLSGVGYGFFLSQFSIAYLSSAEY